MKMEPPIVVVHVRPRRGRPALVEGQQSTPVSVRMSDADYDRLCEDAKRERVTVAELIRRRALSNSVI